MFACMLEAILWTLAKNLHKVTLSLVMSFHPFACKKQPHFQVFQNIQKLWAE
jgi:hypothetical protein